MRSLCLLFLMLFVGCSSSTVKDTNANSVDDFGLVGDFALTERSGKTITNADLQGKFWIASFVFTRCTESCPAVTGTVARLQKELADESNLRFVTFTVDPERDNPDELKRYAEQYRADPERWWFLTGPEEQIKLLLNESFHVSAIRNPNAKTPGQEFDHSSKLVLVDATGKIVGYYDGMQRSKSQEPTKEFEANLNDLKRKVRELGAATGK